MGTNQQIDYEGPFTQQVISPITRSRGPRKNKIEKPRRTD